MSLPGALGEAGEEGPCPLVVDEGGLVGGGGAQDFLDLLDLVQVVLAGKQRPVRHHLSQDAAHTPHVHGLGVTL